MLLVLMPSQTCMRCEARPSASLLHKGLLNLPYIGVPLRTAAQLGTHFCRLLWHPLQRGKRKPGSFLG
jgi:hypothetical protein